jgi:hypothetical protein
VTVVVVAEIIVAAEPNLSCCLGSFLERRMKVTDGVPVEIRTFRVQVRSLPPEITRWIIIVINIITTVTQSPTARCARTVSDG